ncbi:MAG: ATP:cob(I)alamin adenosyltransferase [Candidatus Colwellbacteria bacterium CG10_big_fil_rev_8_21_14_0_10_41_28]|uniref:Corrinoid adenosyltransferase n=1 Tax=Candidatus Colwellbacteria bacterium CG10_big_fil_rev_8_21_14_0_10_41_28 TaxID=1974539 RepID=A0A2H0VHX6_9BACT|nr:MAG: ATP:cob(I)alamin adenosyltransferase [Candidatus Colwellbacteria bacterium CG10_big_fil_rev_8_21_14_0_10_41_28]
MLYTGKGDDGTTKIIGSEKRFTKGSEITEALGSLDELNSFLGICRTKSGDLSFDLDNEGSFSSTIRSVQENLFIIQAQLAGADKILGEGALKDMEALIEKIENTIPPIKGFSIPGGTELSAFLDTARTLARRTEREVIRAKDKEFIKPEENTLAYLNRLSSLLFALARFANFKEGVEEENPSY